ncbi:MAG: 2-C-methyl-D-erythritol 2,4-cyclodiphosphate synthase [Prevotellaceae bacterium]|jgi:2-C-methyl-D-erythritol 2,4-cyclodiphosphate synthase|nr:2-C-methyl-D-erythritol 2,4-cyclodiphosphate synthase [Prevotellaceae bacterium]
MGCNFRIGNGYDVHRLAEGLPLWLGGIEVAHSKGCVAHSDGDVLIHALCDALLGAANLRDIGHHFPDNDAAYKNIDSKILLQKVMDLLRKKGYELVNADITLILQRPKIQSFIEKMQQRLSAVMQVSQEQISLKATTSEGIGFVGREEGVAAYATVLVEKVKGS